MNSPARQVVASVDTLQVDAAGAHAHDPRACSTPHNALAMMPVGVTYASIAPAPSAVPIPCIVSSTRCVSAPPSALPADRPARAGCFSPNRWIAFPQGTCDLARRATASAG